jgi:transcription initiation factor TFIID subunit 5
MEAEKLIFSYFKGKNYRSSENALKSELKNYLKGEGNAAFLQPVNVPAMSELFKAIHDFNQEDVFFETFSGFKDWVETTADFYQNDLRKILGPIFIFTYLEMIRREFYESTDNFFKEFSSCHWDQNDLDRLQKIKSSTQDLGLFSQRYAVSMDPFSFSQLIYYLEAHSQIIILSIINKNLQINLKPCDSPAVLLGKDLKIQLNKSTLSLDDEKIKKENKIPLPFQNDIIQQRLSNQKSRKVLSSESNITIICHTIRNGNEVNCVEVSEDSLILAAGFDDSVIRVFSIPTSSLDSELLGHAGAVFSVSFSPTGDLLLSGSDDSLVKLWSIPGKICLCNFSQHALPVWTVKFAPTGFYFASGSNDKICYLWSMDSYSPLKMFAGHQSDIVSIAFHPKVVYIATASADKTVRVWESSSGECLRIFNKHTRPATFVVFSRDGRVLYSGDEVGDLCAWDLAKKVLIWKVEFISGC